MENGVFSIHQLNTIDLKYNKKHHSYAVKPHFIPIIIMRTSDDKN